MKLIGKLFFSFIFLLGTFVFAKPANASEGMVRLTGVGHNMNCLTMSVLMGERDYDLLVRCANLVYPPAGGVHYVMWVNPLGTTRPDRLGVLEFGKRRFSANQAFSSIFVTREATNYPRNPSSDVVMQGTIEPFSFAPVPQDPIELQATPTPFAVITPTPVPTTLSRLAVGLRRAAFVIIIILLVVGIILWILSRRR